MRACHSPAYIYVQITGPNFPYSCICIYLCIYTSLAAEPAGPVQPEKGKAKAALNGGAPPLFFLKKKKTKQNKTKENPFRENYTYVRIETNKSARETLHMVWCLRKRKENKRLLHTQVTMKFNKYDPTSSLGISAPFPPLRANKPERKGKEKLLHLRWC